MPLVRKRRLPAVGLAFCLAAGTLTASPDTAHAIDWRALSSTDKDSIAADTTNTIAFVLAATGIITSLGALGYGAVRIIGQQMPSPVFNPLPR
ncbi:hypothetical protein [Corynebacterium urinipleomorphum]|uniref:hypothetical protein n=1 Tax=Corynebacterium urinipleomorphum TaxID=1852380 RepID=UPI000B361EB1|nr:hypothetical protein [Corynebacterium urinipleomorphum]